MNVRWAGTIGEFGDLKGDDPLVSHLEIAKRIQTAARDNEAIAGGSLLLGAALPDGSQIPLVLLAGDCAVCLNVVDSAAIDAAEGDRLLAMTRLLAKHPAAKGLRVFGAVVPAGYAGKPVSVGSVKFMPVSRIADFLAAIKIGGGKPDIKAWLSGAIALPKPKAGDAHATALCDALFGGDPDALGALLPKLQKTGFAVYLTQDLDQAKAYCRSRYRGDADKRFGLLASSRARNLRDYGIDNAPKWNKTEPIERESVDMSRWFADGEEKPLSCLRFDRAASENDCGQNRLDFSILLWGDDLKWVSKWRGSGPADNATELRKAAYRVLLCASRDGCILLIPPQLELEGTHRMLRDAGMAVLR